MLFEKRKYKAKLLGRSGVLYEEGDKTMSLEAEMLTGETDLVIYFSSIRNWLTPNETEIVSLEQKDTIKKNVTKELEKKGLVIEWE